MSRLNYSQRKCINAWVLIADEDYCAGRILHYSCALWRQSNYLYGQAMEKYLKALFLKYLFIEKQMTTQQAMDHLKNAYGHKIKKLWIACDKIYNMKKRLRFNTSHIPEVVTLAETLSINIGSRYPGSAFACMTLHPLSVDEVMYFFRNVLLRVKRSIVLNLVNRLRNRPIINDDDSSTIVKPHLIRKYFFLDNRCFHK